MRLRMGRCKLVKVMKGVFIEESVEWNGEGKFVEGEME